LKGKKGRIEKKKENPPGSPGNPLSPLVRGPEEEGGKERNKPIWEKKTYSSKRAGIY